LTVDRRIKNEIDQKETSGFISTVERTGIADFKATLLVYRNGLMTLTTTAGVHYFKCG
jgi:hypothetical protein